MITTKLEAILFAVAKPFPVKQLSKQLNVSAEVIREALDTLKEKMNVDSSGIHVVEQGGKIQFVTNPNFSDDVALFLKKEASGPLTRPSLETLTIIAYRGPITKPEIEQIRGVNCSLILRNLLIRGLIRQKDDVERLQPVFSLSIEMMKKLGLKSVDELPDYDAFNKNEKIDELLAQTTTVEDV